MLKMKTNFLFFIISLFIICSQSSLLAQNPAAPTEGTTKDFVLFTAVGAVTNAGTTSIYTGSVGTNSGDITGFESLLVQPTHLYAQTDETKKCAADLILLYNELVARATTKPDPTGAYVTETLLPGVYHSTTAASIGGDLTLDGNGDPDARFIIKTDGAFTMAAGARILLTNGTQAKNVFWVIGGDAAIAAGTEARGTFLCFTGGAVSMGANCVLEGRVLTQAGAITTLNGMKLAIPSIATNTMILRSNQSISSGAIPTNLVVTGNSNPILKWQSSLDNSFANPLDITDTNTTLRGQCIGNLTTTTYYRAVMLDGVKIEYSNSVKITVSPLTSAPDLGPLADFVLFTSSGAITNAGITTLSGAVGTNSGAISGFTISPDLHIQDTKTASCAAYLPTLFNTIKAIPNTNTTHAATFGAGEILLPGVYSSPAAASVGGQLTLNGNHNPNAIFVFKIIGALNMAAETKINLINGALASNIFWNIGGALNLGANCDVQGTFICLAGAPALGANCTIKGRVFTIAGAIASDSDKITKPNPIELTADQNIIKGAVPADLVLIGNNFPMLKWQRATETTFSNPIDIPFKGSTLQGACIGFITITTYFRAVYVVNGVNTYSNFVTISIPKPPAIPNMDSLNPFVLFTSDGAIGNTGSDSFTGYIGTHAGAITGFNNLSNPNLISTNPLTLDCANNLLGIFNSIKALPITTATHLPAFGAGETLEPGIYEIGSAANMSGTLYLDGLNDPNSIFVFKIIGALVLGTNTKMILTNSAKSSNIFWVIDGAFSAATKSTIVGNYICLAGAIDLGDGCILDGRIATVAGAISLYNCILTKSSNYAPITITNPNIASSDQIINLGETPANLSVSGNTTAILRWEKSTNYLFSNPIVISNTTPLLSSFEMGPIIETTYFRAVIENGTKPLYSTIVIIAIIQTTVPGILATNQTIVIDSAASNLIVSGNIGSIIKWQSSINQDFTSPKDLNEFTNILSSAAIGILNKTTYFRALVQNCVCSEAYTNTVTIEIIAGLISTNQKYCSPTKPSDLVLSRNLDSVIKWQSSTTADFAIPTDVLNQTNTLTGTAIGILPTTTYYRAVVQNCSCCFLYSNTVEITIAPKTTWNGNSWSNGLPEITSSAFLNNNLTASNNIETCNLTVTGTSKIIINPGINVTVSEVLNVASSASFTLENDANLIQIKEAINTGTITVKRESFPLYRLDYTLWTAPVSNQNLKSFSPESPTNNFYFYNSNSAPNGTYNLLYNNSSFSPIPLEATYNFELAKGYLVRAPNNYASYIQAVAPATVSAVAGTIFKGQFYGEPNNGTIPVLLNPALNGYNLVGNPYPSAIDLTSFLIENSNTVEGTIWLWRKINNLTTAAIGYATMTLAGITSTQPGVIALPNNGTIKTGQGFFVKLKTPSTPNTLYFKNNMRTGNDPLYGNTFYKNTNSTETNRIWLNLSNSSNTNIFSQILVAYVDGATNGIDYGIEGKSFGNYNTNLSSIVDNQEFSIQGRNLPFTVSDEVPLGFNTNTAGSFTLSIDHLEGVFTRNQEIFLKDNLTKQSYNLKTAAYTFNSEIGIFNSRFVLVYQNKTLAIAENKIIETGILIYKQNGTIKINTGKDRMTGIELFDLNGKLLFSKNTNKNIEIVEYSGLKNQVLIVKIKTVENGIITQKIIF